MDTNEIIDIAIIGSGPAGMTAGIYGSRAGLNTVAFESVTAGGQIATTEMLDNYPGFPEGIGGFEFAWQTKQQAERFGMKTVNEEVTGLDLAAQPKIIRTAAGEYQARSVVLAMGARNRKMGIEGEDELRGRGLSYCATCDGGFFRGKKVVVYGGANTAVEDALYLSRICEQVTIVYRRDRVRATAILTEAAEAAANIVFSYRSVIEGIHEDEGKLARISVKNVDTGEVSEIETDALFVAIGTIPNSEILEGQLELEGGYVVAGEDCRTSIPGVFVAGDLRTKELRQVVTAVADGAISAESAASMIATGEL